MYIQTLTFRTMWPTPGAIAPIATILDVAIASFPGVVAHRCTETVDSLEAVVIWKDRETVERFRSSDVYAWLSFDPRWDETSDRDFEFEPAVPVRLEEIVGIAA